MFQLVAFKLYAIMKRVYCFNLLPRTSTGSGHREMFLEINLNQKTYLLSVLEGPVQIDYSMLQYGTSMNINILLTYLLKISLTHFRALVSFYSPWTEIYYKTRGFLVFSGGVERGQCHEMGSSVTYFVT